MGCAWQNLCVTNKWCECKRLYIMCTRSAVCRELCEEEEVRMKRYEVRLVHKKMAQSFFRCSLFQILNDFRHSCNKFRIIIIFRNLQGSIGCAFQKTSKFVQNRSRHWRMRKRWPCDRQCSWPRCRVWSLDLHPRKPRRLSELFFEHFDAVMDITSSHSHIEWSSSVIANSNSKSRNWFYACSLITKVDSSTFSPINFESKRIILIFQLTIEGRSPNSSVIAGHQHSKLKLSSDSYRSFGDVFVSKVFAYGFFAVRCGVQLTMCKCRNS